MNIIEIIEKKKNGEVLTKDELKFAFYGYLEDKIPDYQMSSLLMAICLKGMNTEETFALTDLFLHSGDVLDLSSLKGPKADKHSTGGVGDKTTMIIGPMVASCGVMVPKMSGRGLGHTGGTIDKLESIPSFRTNLTEEEFLAQVEDIGFAVTAQTKNLTPLDKKIYALRDVTGTTESIPLIASSIMSKKIAGGADCIVIDVKVGKGALIKTMPDAVKLSQLMEAIGAFYQRKVRTVITPMDTPLGRCVGNRLEVLEAIDLLNGKGDENLRNLCIQLASHMVSMAKEIDYDEAKKEVLESLEDGRAYQKFLEFVKKQGGKLESLSIDARKWEIHSSQDGVIEAIDALQIGELAVSLGAGRLNKGDVIDPCAGIVLNCKVGDSVSKGDILATLYSNKDVAIEMVVIEDLFQIK